jgi:hypothetical protein
MEKHILTKNGILDAQVCSSGTYDEALEFIRITNPAGTENNWQKNEEGKFAPVKCADNPDRTHYMFVC